MFDLPTTGNVEKVVVDESTIEENKPSRCWSTAKPPRRPDFQASLTLPASASRLFADSSWQRCRLAFLPLEIPSGPG
jgi:hypothetical protein